MFINKINNIIKQLEKYFDVVLSLPRLAGKLY